MKYKYIFLVLIIGLIFVGCTEKETADTITNANLAIEIDDNVIENTNTADAITNTTTSSDETNIIFLHHSTGENIWNGGVADWFDNWNQQNETSYNIEEIDFPTDEYGWQN